MLMNALATFASIVLMWRIAFELFGDRYIATASAMIFSLATFAPTYALGIWPHMLSLSFLLGAVYCCLRAADASKNLSAAPWLLATGWLIGAGVNIRVDAILMFPVL